MKTLSKQLALLLIMSVSITSATAQACEWYDVGCWTGSSSGGGGGGGNVTDPLAVVENLIDGIEDSVVDVNDDMNSGFSNIGNEFNSLGNEIDTQFSIVEGQFNSLTGEITGIYQDLLALAMGIDPNMVANTIIYEFQNESNCQQLPQRLDAISQRLLNLSGVHNWGLPQEVTNNLNLINFSQLDIIGIDPATANAEDLYYYKITTVKPLSTLKGMTGSVYKIPFVIGSLVANACADATALRIGQRVAKHNLDNQIHQELSRPAGLANLRFRMPQAQGGNIEDVEALVADLIASYQNMGADFSDDAIEYLQKGQRYYAQGKYAKAFKSYKKSYMKLSDDDDHDNERDEEDDD